MWRRDRLEGEGPGLLCTLGLGRGGGTSGTEARRAHVCVRAYTQCDTHSRDERSGCARQDRSLEGQADARGWWPYGSLSPAALMTTGPRRLVRCYLSGRTDLIVHSAELWRVSRVSAVPSSQPVGLVLPPGTDLLGGPPCAELFLPRTSRPDLPVAFLLAPFQCHNRRLSRCLGSTLASSPV